jgi:CDP-4-dehydro-6-deoxyglucose reductase, E1
MNILNLYGVKIPLKVIYKKGRIKMKCKVAGQVFDHTEKENLYRVIDREWYTEGMESEEFSKELASYFGVYRTILTNSGSSANLLTLSALMDQKIPNPLRKGDKVVTAAGAAFPTTVAPVLQLGLIPIFIDVEPPFYVPAKGIISNAVNASGARAVMTAHTLGMPWNLDEVEDLLKKGIWVIEDNCDAVGSEWRGQKTGSFGDAATCSFYPAHHITSVEGGAILTKSSKIGFIVNSLRQWHRQCWCMPGRTNTCKMRFNCNVKGLPDDADHKYTYFGPGYSMKTSDLHSAVGRAQLKKIEVATAIRRRNYNLLKKNLEEFSDILILPEHFEEANPSPFGFPITISSKAKFSRREFTRFLEERDIETRQLFAGNIVRQGTFAGCGQIYGALKGSDNILFNSLWIGCFPGLTEEHIDYMSNCIVEFIRKR